MSAILWYASFTALTALAWGPWSVSRLPLPRGDRARCPLVVDPSMLSEYLPRQNRGRFLVFLDFFWPALGSSSLLALVGLLDQIGGDPGWRHSSRCVIPAFLAFLARLSPESSYWLARNGRTEEAADVLEEITGGPVDAEEIAVNDQPEKLRQ